MNTDLKTLTSEEMIAELNRRNANKRENREAMKQLQEEIVPVVANDLIQASNMLQSAKKQAFQAFSDILALKAEVYGVKDSQQSHTFSTEDYSVTIGYRVNDAWDDSAKTGEALVKEFVASLAKDDDSKFLVDAITTYMKPDAKGNLKASRILELQKLAIKHQREKLIEGVNLIIEGHKLVRSNWYVECQAKNASGVMENVPLAISTVDFPADFNFDFLNPKKPENA